MGFRFSLPSLAIAIGAGLALSAAPAAHAQAILISNLAQPSNSGGGDSFASSGLVAQGFLTNNQVYRLGIVTLSLYADPAVGSNSPSAVTLSLFSNRVGQDRPDVKLLTLGTDTITGITPANYAFFSTSNFALSASTSYFLVASGTGNTVFNNTNAPNTNTLPGSVYALGSYGNSTDGGATYSYTPRTDAGFGPYKFAIQSAAAPKPGDLALLVAGISVLGAVLARRRRA